MATKLQLLHPAGKKAVSMDNEKYEVLKKAILTYLKSKGEVAHKQMFEDIERDFTKNKIPFEGKLGWHLEWVKLDLEARKKIKRVGEKSPVKYALA